jgi:prophage regulatory protein
MSDISNTERRPRLVVLRADDVAAKTGLSISSIYRLMAEGKFPRSVKLGDAATGWLLHEVNAWIIEKIEKRNQALLAETADQITPSHQQISSNPLLAKPFIEQTEIK